MGKSSGSAPSSPDPNVVAAAQGSANIETALASARLNQVDEHTPFGNAIYSPSGQTFTTKGPDGEEREIDLFRRDVTLSPQQQQLLDLENSISQQALSIGGDQVGRIGDAIGSPIDLSGLPAAPTTDDAARQQVQDALYSRHTAELDPRFEDDQRRLETSLINSGFSRNSKGYRDALEDFNRSKNSAYDQALTSSIVGGGNEMAQMFGLDSNARNQALQEMFATRNQPINELSALLGTSGGVNVPQFGGVPQTGIANTDITGPAYASYNAELDAYNAAQNRSNSTLGSLFGLGGAALGGWLSDEDAKTDKRPVDDEDVLRSVRKMPVESWRYKAGGPRKIGPYAQDMAEEFGGDGRTIEPQMAFGVSLGAIQALADKVDRLEKRVRA